jgi:cardiolipin synthase
VPPPPAWEERFLDAGVEWRMYRPTSQWDLLSPGSWRRLHRKLCVVDGAIAFCGGINILDDFHDPNHGELSAPRFDFAVQARGPLVAFAHLAMRRMWMRFKTVRGYARLAGAMASIRSSAEAAVPLPESDPAESNSRAALVLRDNFRNRARIEQAYRRAIGHAREEVIIANAYFVPGGKMRRALISAAKRGVKVSLLLQGRYEYFMQYYASRPVYGALLAAGVEIYEYSASFLHAKVAVVDGRWATVGSSNLDPLSLLLAREANVVVEDEPFAQQLRTRLRRAMAEGGRRMEAAEYAGRPLHQRIMERVALVVMRVLLLVQGKKYL